MQQSHPSTVCFCTCSAKTDRSGYTALGLNHGREHSSLQAEKVDFCGMKELEPPSHSIQDILDGISPSTSSELTGGATSEWGCAGLPPSHTHTDTHTRCPCCHRRLIRQDVDAFPTGSVNRSKSPCGHVIANARTGARAGRKEEQDQHFGSRPQLNWIKRNMKLYPKKTHHVAMIFICYQHPRLETEACGNPYVFVFSG